MDDAAMYAWDTPTQSSWSSPETRPGPEDQPRDRRRHRHAAPTLVRVPGHLRATGGATGPRVLP